MIRLLFFIFIVLSTVFNPVIFFVAAFSYALRYTAYELIVLSGMIDVFYAYQYMSIPYYTLVTIIGLLVIEYIKPRLSLYNQ